MKIKTSIFFIFSITLFLFSCKEKIRTPKSEYNHKANELIQQLISEENCNCILEIPKEDIVKLVMLENPNINSENYIKKLSLKNKKELDSLIKISESFKLDENYIKSRNIQIIKRDSIRILFKDLNFVAKRCKKGVIYFLKPIFNKKFDVAIINYGRCGFCCALGSQTFIYKNCKWELKLK